MSGEKIPIQSNISASHACGQLSCSENDRQPRPEYVAPDASMVDGAACQKPRLCSKCQRKPRSGGSKRRPRRRGRCGARQRQKKRRGCVRQRQKKRRGCVRQRQKKRRGCSRNSDSNFNESQKMGYLSYLKCYRRMHRRLSTMEVIRRGAKNWLAMSQARRNYLIKLDKAAGRYHRKCLNIPLCRRLGRCACKRRNQRQRR